MTDTEMRETVRQMLIDWNNATHAQRVAARKEAAAAARAALVTYPVVRKDGRVVSVTIPND